MSSESFEPPVSQNSPETASNNIEASESSASLETSPSPQSERPTSDASASTHEDLIKSIGLDAPQPERSCEPNHLAQRSNILQARAAKEQAAENLEIVSSVKEKGNMAFAHIKDVRQDGKNLGDAARSGGVWRNAKGQVVSPNASAILDAAVEKKLIETERVVKESFETEEAKLHYLRENAPQEAGGWLPSEKSNTISPEIRPESRTYNAAPETMPRVNGKEESHLKPAYLEAGISRPSMTPLEEKAPPAPEKGSWDAGRHFFITSAERLPSSAYEEAHEEVRRTFEKIADEELEGSRPLSPEINRFKNNTERWHEERFQRLDIKEAPAWSDRIGQKTFLRDTQNLNNPSGAEGASGFGIILIKDYEYAHYEPASQEQLQSSSEFLPIAVPVEVLGELSREDAAKHFRDYVQAETLVHEKYHEARSKEIRLESAGTGNDIMIEEAHLAEFPEALEEGMAMWMQQQAQKEIDRTFPEGAALQKRLLRHVLDTHPKLRAASEQTQDLFRIKDFDGKSVMYGAKRYVFSAMFVDFLSKTLGDGFEGAVEKLRMGKQQKPLVDLIKRSFGEEGVELVFQATESTASSIIQRLAQLRQERL